MYIHQSGTVWSEKSGTIANKRTLACGKRGINMQIKSTGVVKECRSTVSVFSDFIQKQLKIQIFM